MLINDQFDIRAGDYVPQLTDSNCLPTAVASYLCDASGGCEVGELVASQFGLARRARTRSDGTDAVDMVAALHRLGWRAELRTGRYSLSELAGWVAHDIGVILLLQPLDQRGGHAVRLLGLRPLLRYASRANPLGLIVQVFDPLVGRHAAAYSRFTHHPSIEADLIRGGGTVLLIQAGDSV